MVEEEGERVRVVKPVPEATVKPTPKVKPVPIEPTEVEEGLEEEDVEERLAAEEETHTINVFSGRVV